MITSEKVDALTPAWIEALNALSTVSMDASGHHGKYATLGAVLAVSRPVLAEHGLAIHQYARPSEAGTVTVITRLWHTSGQWIEDDGLRMPAPADPQKVGGAVSYARRYSLTAFLSLTADDDDGQEASNQIRGEAQRPRKAAAKKAAPTRDGFTVGARAVAAARAINGLSEPERAALETEVGDSRLTVQALKADEAHLTAVEAWLAPRMKQSELTL